MPRITLVLRVLQGKSEADVRSIGAMVTPDPEADAESRRRGGVTVERAYLHPD